MVAISDYKGQYGDELSFKTGDKLEVTLDGKLVLSPVHTHHSHTLTPQSVMTGMKESSKVKLGSFQKLTSKKQLRSCVVYVHVCLQHKLVSISFCNQ